MKHRRASATELAAGLHWFFRGVLAIGGWSNWAGAFFARGYRRSTSASAETAGRFPISAWITGRDEDRSADRVEETFVPKVELRTVLVDLSTIF